MNTGLLAIGGVMVSVAIGGSIAVAASGLFPSVSQSQKAAVLQQFQSNQQQHDKAVLNRMQNGLPASTSLGSEPVAVDNPPLGRPQIVSAADLYPPVSSGVFTCTNYYNDPGANIMVLAGANPSTPTRGEFMIATNSRNSTVMIPPGDGVPTLTEVNGTRLTFKTSTGASGTLDYQTGDISINN